MCHVISKRSLLGQLKRPFIPRLPTGPPLLGSSRGSNDRQIQLQRYDLETVSVLTCSVTRESRYQFYLHFVVITPDGFCLRQVPDVVYSSDRWGHCKHDLALNSLSSGASFANRNFRAWTSNYGHMIKSVCNYPSMLQPQWYFILAAIEVRPWWTDYTSQKPCVVITDPVPLCQIKVLTGHHCEVMEALVASG